MRDNQGTPKTIDQAIVNALKEISPEREWSVEDKEVKVLMTHIQDRLAQSFGVYAMENDSGTVISLWKSIFSKWTSKIQAIR